ncbi:MAG: hypothetical protein GY811_21260 [Myxococcales bacterium]|nr:hypothetical protein [Myxococcales bacterium]
MRDSDEHATQDIEPSAESTRALAASRSQLRAKGPGPSVGNTKPAPSDAVDDLLDPENPEVIVEALDLLGGPIVGAEVFERDAPVGETNGQGLLRLPSKQTQVSGIRNFRVRAHGC